jgi:hypothetical protein
MAQRGRPRKNSEETQDLGLELPSVKVFSMREGDIILPEGVLKKNETLEVSDETAQYLVAQFKELVKIL